MTERLKKEFINIYKNRIVDPVFFFSPGRVNLIGEHTDYNMGFVFPCALEYGTYLAVAKNKTNTVRLRTLNFEFTLDIDLDSINKPIKGEWVNYPLGVIKEFLDRGIELGGIDMLYSGNIPNGAGLSSSASIEMVTAVALDNLFKAGISRMEMVKLSQSAENNFVGMNCGIMDQFAVGFGEKNKAIFLNCNNLDYRTVAIELNKYQLIIVNTNKRRDLTDSKYNERRSECESAVMMISRIRPIEHLSELSIEDMKLVENTISDTTILSRARHIITENNRVLEAVQVLHTGKLIRFGELMNQSHDSLKDDYDVTGKELDALVYEARKIEGVIGSRMTGAGFGGCTVNLVEIDKADSFIEELDRKYTTITGLRAEFYKPSIGDGAKVLDI